MKRLVVCKVYIINSKRGVGVNNMSGAAARTGGLEKKEKRKQEIKRITDRQIGIYQLNQM